MLQTRAQFAREMADQRLVVELLTEALGYLGTGGGSDRAAVITLLTLGDSCRLLGEYVAASQRLDEALAIARETVDADLLAAAHNARGILAKDCGGYADAANHYNEALELVALQASAASPRLLAALHHNVAGLAYAEGRFPDSESAARRAIEYRLASGGPSTAVAADRTVLGAALTELNILDEAEDLFRQSIATWRSEHGADHYEVAVNLHNLSAVYRRRGELDLAQQAVEKALTIKQSVLGDAHPEIAALLNTLATLQDERGGSDSVAATYRQALDIFRRTLGPEHRATRTCASNLAAVIEQQV